MYKWSGRNTGGTNCMHTNPLLTTSSPNLHLWFHSCWAQFLFRHSVLKGPWSQTGWLFSAVRVLVCIACFVGLFKYFHMKIRQFANFGQKIHRAHLGILSQTISFLVCEWMMLIHERVSGECNCLLSTWRGTLLNFFSICHYLLIEMGYHTAHNMAILFLQSVTRNDFKMMLHMGQTVFVPWAVRWRRMPPSRMTGAAHLTG